jgi:hypothetical protein
MHKEKLLLVPVSLLLALSSLAINFMSPIVLAETVSFVASDVKDLHLKQNKTDNFNSQEFQIRQNQQKRQWQDFDRKLQEQRDRQWQNNKRQWQDYNWRLQQHNTPKESLRDIPREALRDRKLQNQQNPQEIQSQDYNRQWQQLQQQWQNDNPQWQDYYRQ